MVLSGFIVNTASGLMFEIGLIIIIATVFTYIARLLRQPLIPAYVLTGLILGPIGLGLIKDIKLIESLSEIGIIFLLFIVGLEINFSKLRKVGRVSAMGGLAQVLLTFYAGFAAGKYLLGFTTLTSVYAGLIVAFSSTMVVIKLLSDKEKLDTLHGRIMIGFLLVQDVLVIFALSLLSSAAEFSYTILLIIFVKVILILGFAALLNRYVIYHMFRFAAKSAEVLFLLSLTICFLFVLLAYILGFSIAIGAFIGGVTLANLPYHFNIIGRISPLKDFFSTIFFVSLGMQLVFASLGKLVVPLITLLALILILKPLIILLILSYQGMARGYHSSQRYPLHR
jgi:Kef-type K+ transport system membrane component KefB